MNSELNQQIEELEKQHFELTEKLVKLKRARTNNEVVQDHHLQNWNGSTTKLSEMFGEKTDLILIHNMGIGCSYCTLWADGLNGFAKPLADRSAFAVVSPDSIETQRKIAESRGWTFNMYSSKGCDFTAAMGFSVEKDGKTYYHPGFSTFRRHEDGSITRVAFDYFGPGDMYCAPWHMFELLHGGVDGWDPKMNYDK